MHKIFIISASLFLFNSCSEAQTSNSKSTIEVEQEGPVNKVVTAEEFNNLLSQENIQIIDVRTSGEYAEGYIKGAVNIDFFGADFKSEINALDKDIVTLIYCKSGGRSGKAAKIMADLGYRVVYDLSGGYMNWPYK